MKKKLKQVADNIHGTIYLSDLESELISTPYFYRLNDIYQSSTVYMTFPSNRTKRYEHSLGTMSLASRMLYSAVTNADGPTKSVLFNQLKKYFLEIIEIITEEENEELYFKTNKDLIDLLFDRLQISNEEKAIKCIKDAVIEGEFNDTALDFYQYYPTECIKDPQNNNVENIFLYRCLLQSIRIVSLFHDVGHPPYSHIIENVLNDIYKTITSDLSYDWDKDKVKTFNKCLKRFISKDTKDAYKCKRLFTNSSLIDADLHERIGLSLLESAVDSVVPEIIESILKKQDDSYKKLAHILYYIIVIEFAFAILTESNPLFKSFHKIIDGVLDADRLDYIVRDSQNSGVDWGKIPYERIINSSKLFYLEKDNSGNPLDESEKSFAIAYPNKISDDIEDLIIVRYKIFARINFHHRCIKTSVALQAATRALAIDYLTTPTDSECINPDISILWTALSKKVGNKKMRIIQWNDSWLISALHKALVYLYSNENCNSTEKKMLKENLEEILLNKRKYYTLLKRGRDNSNFVESVLNFAGISKTFLDNLREEEYKKYYENIENTVKSDNILSNPKSESIDSIKRINTVFDSLDLEYLCNIIPLDGCNLKKLLEKTLSKNNKISNYAVIINDGRQKNGLPKHKSILDGIYVYKNNDCNLFNEHFSLSMQINALEKNVPWLFVYFIPKDSSCNVDELSQELFELLAKEVAKSFKKRVEELFPNKFITA